MVPEHLNNMVTWAYVDSGDTRGTVTVAWASRDITPKMLKEVSVEGEL